MKYIQKNIHKLSPLYRTFFDYFSNLKKKNFFFNQRLVNNKNLDDKNPL